MIDLTATPDGEEYRNCTIIIIPQNVGYSVGIREPNGVIRHKFLADTYENSERRAREIIDLQINRGIIEPMKVTKERTLQLGDIVTIRTNLNKTAQIGIIDAVRGDGYWVSHVKQVNGFYKRMTSEVCYQQGNLSHYPDREKWIRIKSDLDRQGDADIIKEWLDAL